MAVDNVDLVGHINLLAHSLATGLWHKSNQTDFICIDQNHNHIASDIISP